MKLKQEKKEYRPITIEFDEEHEAKIFFDLVDKLGDPVCFISSAEKLLVTKLSNARTNLVIDI